MPEDSLGHSVGAGGAVLEWVLWYSTTRVHSAIGYITPCEAEAAYWAAQRATSPVSGVPSA